MEAEQVLEELVLEGPWLLGEMALQPPCGVEVAVVLTTQQVVVVQISSEQVERNFAASCLEVAFLCALVEPAMGRECLLDVASFLSVTIPCLHVLWDSILHLR